MVWWSDGQSGYYFSNLQNYYMSPTHIHIYKIKGNKYCYSSKINNKKHETGCFTADDQDEAIRKIADMSRELFNISQS
jgi:hypothetical protein